MKFTRGTRRPLPLCQFSFWRLLSQLALSPRDARQKQIRWPSSVANDEETDALVERGYYPARIGNEKRASRHLAAKSTATLTLSCCTDNLRRWFRGPANSRGEALNEVRVQGKVSSPSKL